MANPKQYIITPNPDIDSRDNIESVSSEAGAHVGPAFPTSTNEGAMVPFQETYGVFTETDIDYKLVKSGGVGSAEWVWKKKGESDKSWKGVGDIRNQTNLHNPFQEYEGTPECGNLGMASVVSRAHNKLLLFKRTKASTNYGRVSIASRSLDAENPTLPEAWKVSDFEPKTYFSATTDVDANMWFVGACELDDGSLRMVGSYYNDETSLWDLHLFGSNDGGLTWELLQQKIISRWYNQNDSLVYPEEVRSISNLKMAASGSWIRIVWVGPADEKFHTLVSSDRGATWENPAPPPYKYMYQPFLHSDMWNDYDPGTMCAGTGNRGAAHAGWYPWTATPGEMTTTAAASALMSGGDTVEGFNNIASSPNGRAYPQADISSSSNPGNNNYFDLVSVGGSEGSFALVFHARPNTSSSDLGGSDPTRCTYLCGGVRESGWGIARLISSPQHRTPTEWYGSATTVKENANQQRPFQQFCFTDTQVSAVTTPSWIYILIFSTPGQTGGSHVNGGWNSSPSGNPEDNIREPFGRRRGFGAYSADGNVSAAAGPWGFTAQKCGWKGYRVPTNDPFGGVVQKLHVSDINGHLFPAAVGQGKMLVPSNVVLAWDGQRIVVFNGIGHNGALDAYSNCQTPRGNSGPTGSLAQYGEPSSRKYNLVRYGFTYYRNYWQDKTNFNDGFSHFANNDVTDPSGHPPTASFVKAFEAFHADAGLEYSAEPVLWGISVHKGRGRRQSYFDAPLTYEIDKTDATIYHAKQEQKGRNHCAVSSFGGWDEQPLTEPDGFSTGNILCSPFFADTWQAQHGIPHYNALGASWTGNNGSTEPERYSPFDGWPHMWNSEGGVISSAWYLGGVGTGGTSIPSGGSLVGFNIIGQATPGPVSDDGREYAAAFIDTAQAPAFGSDTGLLCRYSWRIGYSEYMAVASASQWTVRSNRKYLKYAGGVGTSGSKQSVWCSASSTNQLASSWPWDRVSRDLGDRTIDWESDRVTIRQNFTNKRTGLTGTNRDNTPIAFTTWRSGNGFWEMLREYVGVNSTFGFSDGTIPTLPGSLWGASPYMKMPSGESSVGVEHRLNSTFKYKGYNRELFTEKMVTSSDMYSSEDNMRSVLEQGRPIPLGNNGVIEFVCSVPHKGLRGSDKNPNMPEKHVTTSSGDNGKAGNWRLAAVSCRYYTDQNGYNAGGNFRVSEFCVAIGQASSGDSDVAVLVDQQLWDIQDSSISRKDPIHLATIDLGSEAMGTADAPRFWKFRVVLWQETSTKQKIKLLAREYGSRGAWLESPACDMRGLYLGDLHSATQHEYKWGTSYGGEEKAFSLYGMQMCQWGKLDEQVTDNAWDGQYLSSDSYQGGSGTASGTQVADHEYVSYWKEFNVSHPGTGGIWRQSNFKNPTSLSGMVCSPIPVHVCTGIYARWGGGGGFVNDTFSGTVDHTYAVENIFRPSPSTKWKSNDAIPATGGPECSITLSAFGSAGSPHTRTGMRTYANWVAFYGTQDRKFLVDFSRDKYFDSSKTITYEANSLITENASVVKVAGTHFELADPNHIIKDGQLAGHYCGWNFGTGNAQCIRIKTNVHNADEGRVSIFADLEDPDTIANMRFPVESLSGRGLSTARTVDIWSDRSAINLYSPIHVRYIPSEYSDAEEFMDNGFSWMRIRFFETGATTSAGTYEYDIRKGDYTIDQQHTISNVIVGHGTEFETPINWTFTESVRPNVKIKVSPSGVKSAYTQGPPRTSYSLAIPGDGDQFRYKLSQLLKNNAEFTKKPVSLLMSTEADTPSLELDNAIRADKRYNVLARLTGAVSDQNIAWRKDPRGVWYTVGDLALTFEEEV